MRVPTIYGVVLAGGDGSRLREMTTTETGEIVPKQFCSLKNGACLLEDAVKRAQAVASNRHLCSVVAEQHHHWWSSALKGLPEHNIFVQPTNRGTAHGILLALLQIQRRDSDAIVALLPADHYASDEAILARSLRFACALAAENPSLVCLLGAEPDHPDQDLGYIVPNAQRRGAAAGVMRFVEKPSSEKARELIENGALWNTLIFAGCVRALLSLFEGSFDSTIESMNRALKFGNEELVGYLALESVYMDLMPADFSRDVLQRHPQKLQVVRVPNCGWTDLGTPKRVAAVVRDLALMQPATNDFAADGEACYLELSPRQRPLWMPLISRDHELRSVRL